MSKNNLLIKKNHPVVEKTFRFSLNVLELYILLLRKNEFEISEKLLGSSTNIRRNVEGALAAVSKQEFMEKIALAANEATEARFWLKMVQMKYLKSSGADECVEQLNEIINILNYMVQKKSTHKLKIPVYNLN